MTTSSVNISSVKPSPTNPRKHFDEDALAELVASVKTHGVLQAILVRPVNGHFECIAGERRLRAAKKAGLESIPADVRELTDQEVLEIQLIENLQRQDLSPLEEADQIKAILDTDMMTVDDLAEKIGKSKSFVYGRLKLTALSEKGRKALFAGQLSPSTALLVARMPSEELQRELLAWLLAPDYAGVLPSYDDALRYIEEEFLLRLKDAPFDTKDAKLVPAAGACGDCPKRTGAQRELFPEVKSADLCTDRKCWENKVEAHGKRAVKDARAKGLKVLEGRAAVSARNDSRAYVDASDTCWEDPKRRTYKQLLGKDAPAPVVLVLEDAVKERLPAADVAAALKKAGHDFAKKRAASPLDPGEKQRRARQEIERRIDRAMVAKVVAAFEAAGGNLGNDMARVLAACAVKFAWSDVKSLVAGRRGVGDGKKGYAVEPALLKYCATLDAGQAIGLLVEILLGHDQNNAMEQSLCASLRIDRKALAAEVKAAAKAEKSAPKKTPPAKRPSKRSLKKAVDELNAQSGAGDQGVDEDTGDPVPGVCRVCGCTESMPCPDGCAWSDAKRTLCSACEMPQGAKPRGRKAKGGK